MTKTPFAGLESIPPGGSLSTDNYAFQSRDPTIIDSLLKVGAITHRHDAHAAMANPTTAPEVATSTGGDGTISSSTTIYVAYTLDDPNGGESLPTAPVTVTTAPGYADPTTAPTAVLSFSAGSLLANTNMYAVTVTDGNGGETALGPPVTITVTPSAHAEVLISGLTAITDASSDSSTTAGWRLWRSLDGGSTWYLMMTGAYGTDTWTDDGTTAGDCAVSPPLSGTTGNSYSMTVEVPSTDQPASATFINIYACTDGQFLSPCLIATLPISDLGAVQTFTSLAPQAGSPPAVSSCLQGANQLDPDTDLLYWYWKAPVASVGALPSTGNNDGDVRVVTTSPPTIYIWSATDSAWTEWGSSVVPAGGANNPVLDASAARPTGLETVYWTCATQPTNWEPGDIWLRVGS